MATFINLPNSQENGSVDLSSLLSHPTTLLVQQLEQFQRNYSLDTDTVKKRIKYITMKANGERYIGIVRTYDSSVQLVSTKYASTIDTMNVELLLDCELIPFMKKPWMYKSSGKLVSPNRPDQYQLTNNYNILVVLDVLTPTMPSRAGLSIDERLKILEDRMRYNVLYNPMCHLILIKRVLRAEEVKLHHFSALYADGGSSQLYDGVLLLEEQRDQVDEDDGESDDYMEQILHKVKWGANLTLDIFVDSIPQELLADRIGDLVRVNGLVRADDHYVEEASQLVPCRYPVLVPYTQTSRSRVIECKFDPRSEVWIFCRNRNDKSLCDSNTLSHENKFSAAAIEEHQSKAYNNATIKTLITHIQEQSRSFPGQGIERESASMTNEERRSLIAWTKGNHFYYSSGIYGSDVAVGDNSDLVRSHPLSLMYRYHDAVKIFLYSLFNDGIVIDIGSGRFLLRHLWEQLFSRVVAIEKNPAFIHHFHENTAVDKNIISAIKADMCDPFLCNQLGTALGGRADACFLFFSLQGALDSPTRLERFLETIQANLQESAALISIVLDGDALREAKEKVSFRIYKPTKSSASDAGSESEERELLFDLDSTFETKTSFGYLCSFYSLVYGEYIEETAPVGLSDPESPLNAAMLRGGFQFTRSLPMSSLHHIMPLQSQALFDAMSDTEHVISDAYRVVIWNKATTSSRGGQGTESQVQAESAALLLQRPPSAVNCTLFSELNEAVLLYIFDFMDLSSHFRLACSSKELLLFYLRGRPWPLLSQASVDKFTHVAQFSSQRKNPMYSIALYRSTRYVNRMMNTDALGALAKLGCSTGCVLCSCGQFAGEQVAGRSSQEVFRESSRPRALLAGNARNPALFRAHWCFCFSCVHHADRMNDEDYVGWGVTSQHLSMRAALFHGKKSFVGFFQVMVLKSLFLSNVDLLPYQERYQQQQRVGEGLGEVEVEEEVEVEVEVEEEEEGEVEVEGEGQRGNEDYDSGSVEERDGDIFPETASTVKRFFRSQPSTQLLSNLLPELFSPLQWRRRYVRNFAHSMRQRLDQVFVNPLLMFEYILPSVKFSVRYSPDNPYERHEVVEANEEHAKQRTLSIMQGITSSHANWSDCWLAARMNQAVKRDHGALSDRSYDDITNGSPFITNYW